MDKWEFIMEHAEHSKFLRAIPEGWIIGEAGNRSCGDFVKIGIKVENGRIEDICFQHSGCMVSRASSSVMCSLAEGKALDEASRISFDDLLAEFRGTIQTRQKCAKVAYEAFMNALEKASKNSR